MEGEPAVLTRSLSRSYGGLPAVRDLDLEIPYGQLFALLGPDGAGKTTTLRMLGGALEPTSGSARLLGFDLDRDRQRIKEAIGYLSQRFSLYTDLSVEENLEFFAEIHGVKDYRLRSAELLRFTRLEPFRRRLAEHLSGGMKQKLALACSLIHRPRLLLLDEPTTGVDPVSRRDFMTLLESLRKEGMTILMTTTYMDEAESSDLVGLLEGGRLLAAGQPASIRARLPGQMVELRTSQGRAARRVLEGGPAPGEVQLFGDRLHLRVEDWDREGPETAAILQRAGVEILGMRRVPARLEDAFIFLIREQRRKGNVEKTG